MDLPYLALRLGNRCYRLPDAVSDVSIEFGAGEEIVATKKSNPKKASVESIDEYIASFPPDIQAILEKIRLTIRRAAPGAQETISYKIPTFVLNGTPLAHFAAFKKHIGLFPPMRGDAKLVKAAAIYAGEKGNLRFPLDQPIPYALVGKLVTFRAKQLLKASPPSKR
jgi:uncharacterized protein YdhG (YjbR/CyaY superfamily)